MVKLIIHDLSKKFGKQVLFSGFTQTFQTGECVAITGTNGSGKSTFLQTLSGFIQPATGSVVLIENEKNISTELHFRKMSFTAPYLDLPGEISLREIFGIHQSLGCISYEFTESEFLQKSGGALYADRMIKYFSSGMMQRAKLALAFSSNAEILFLDEPLSNLDSVACSWFINELRQHINHKLIFIASNHVENEISLAGRKINLPDFAITK